MAKLVRVVSVIFVFCFGIGALFAQDEPIPFDSEEPGIVPGATNDADVLPASDGELAPITDDKAASTTTTTMTASE